MPPTPRESPSPKDKPRVERALQYVRGNFFAGEEFVDLADAQARAEKWCREIAGLRIHGTTAARPAEVFAECEATALGAVPDPYDVPIFTRVKVHRDFHIEVGKALYWAPKHYIGQHLDVRAACALVKLFHRGQLVKTHPRQRPGGRGSDPDDLPEHKAGYALRDLDQLVTTAGKHGPEVGIYAQRLLDDKLPWTRMRQVYRLLGLARRYGDTPVNTACARALALDVVSVTKIASMLEQASENTPAPLPPPVSNGAARFARDPAEFTPHRPALTLLNGGKTAR